MREPGLDSLFGGPPPGKKLDTKFVELMLRAVDSGRELLACPSIPTEERTAKAAQLWRMHDRARGMIWRELERRRKKARELEQAQEERNQEFYDEDDEDDFDDF